MEENTAGNQRGSNSVGHARLHDDDDGDDDMMMMVIKMMMMKRSGKSETKSERIKPRCTAVRLHVYLVFVKSIEQELKIQ